MNKKYLELNEENLSLILSIVGFTPYDVSVMRTQILEWTGKKWDDVFSWDKQDVIKKYFELLKNNGKEEQNED